MNTRSTTDESVTALTPCSVPPCDTDGTGEPCWNHEREQAHTEGEHAFCGPECEPKLVRDRIPEIIGATGATPITYTADPAEYRRRLRDKLSEEVAEFLGADDAHAPEELADVLEVVHALAADLGVGTDQLEKIRAAKASERGGFAGRVVWCGNEGETRA